MHAYLLVLGITPCKVGGLCPSLPLHCTLAHWFWLPLAPGEFAKLLRPVMQSAEPCVLTAGEQLTYTGKTKHGTVPVLVNSIALTPQLQALHAAVCDILETHGVSYTEPQYMRDGYHPHVTHQGDAQLQPGEVRVAHTVYLVEAPAPESGNDRTVRAAFPLG